MATRGRQVAVAYVSKNASKEPNPITPEALESFATFREEHGESVASVYRRAARTIRALQASVQNEEIASRAAQLDMDKWQRRADGYKKIADDRGRMCKLLAERAEKAEQALEALRVETADLREIERCKASIDAAGATCTEINGCPVADWQSAERAAWEHAAAPFRARIEAAGYELQLRYAKQDFCPVTVYKFATHRHATGHHGDSPTFGALDEAAAWAEAHPANVDPGEPGGDCTVETTWKDGAVVNVQCETAPGQGPDDPEPAWGSEGPCAYCLHEDAKALPCRDLNADAALCKHAAAEPNDLPDLWTPKPEFAPVDTPAARALLALMQKLNDDCWSAGWMADAEYDLWERVCSADRLWGNGYITIQDAKDLRHWSNECGGWIVHRDGAFWFVPIEDWRRMYDAHTPA